MISRRLEIVTHSEAETRLLGQKIGALLSQRLILALTGDLGSGKTCLVQGLAQGLEVADGYPVTSPTFTLINEYPGRLKLHHVDLYRLEYPVDCDEFGLGDIFAGGDVVAIEWADRLQPDELVDHLAAAIEILDDSRRKVTFAAAGQSAVEILKKLEKN